jgi:subtilisin family serine protease
VRRIDAVNIYRRTFPRPLPKQAAAAKAVSPYYGYSFRALKLMGVTRVFDEGLLSRDNAGKGIRIAVLDAGFNIHEPCFAHFTGSTVIAKRDYVAGMIDTSIPFDTTVEDDSLSGQGQEDHGTGVLSLLAARDPGTMVGVAPYADFALLKTERTDMVRAGLEYETVDEEDAWISAVEWVVDSVGVDLLTSSLGYRYDFSDGRPDYSIAMLNGDSLPITRIADSAARKGVPVFLAVGNDGDRGASSLSAPADGKDVIAVGSTDVSGMISLFSAYGPTGDNRGKPDLTAPGEGVTVAEASGGYNTRGRGTSYATPLAAGACALLMQADPALKGDNAALKKRLTEFAYFTQVVPTEDRTNPQYGAGILNLYAAITQKNMTQPYRGTDFWIADQPITTGRACLVFQLSGVSEAASQYASLKISIYTLSGKLIRRFELQKPDLIGGRNEIFWMTDNEAGKTVAPGIYLVRATYSDGFISNLYLRKLAITR